VDGSGGVGGVGGDANRIDRRPTLWVHVYININQNNPRTAAAAWKLASSTRGASVSFESISIRSDSASLSMFSYCRVSNARKYSSRCCACSALCRCISVCESDCPMRTAVSPTLRKCASMSSIVPCTSCSCLWCRSSSFRRWGASRRPSSCSVSIRPSTSFPSACSRSSVAENRSVSAAGSKPNSMPPPPPPPPDPLDDALPPLEAADASGWSNNGRTSPSINAGTWKASGLAQRRARSSCSSGTECCCCCLDDDAAAAAAAAAAAPGRLLEAEEAALADAAAGIDDDGTPPLRLVLLLLGDDDDDDDDDMMMSHHGPLLCCCCLLMLMMMMM
jgi:hypothetical protein